MATLQAEPLVLTGLARNHEKAHAPVHITLSGPKEYETAGMDMFPLAGGVNSMLRLAINR